MFSSLSAPLHPFLCKQNKGLYIFLHLGRREYLQAIMYPKVKVKVQKEEDDLYAYEQSSLESLKAFEWLSLHYSASDESPVSIARIPQSYASKSPSKDSDNKKTVLEENRKSVRPLSAPRPRAVLSSPDNDGIIGIKTQTRAKPNPGLKTRPSGQNRHIGCKVFPKSSGAESLAPAKGYDHKESTQRSSKTSLKR